MMNKTQPTPQLFTAFPTKISKLKICIQIHVCCSTSFLHLLKRTKLELLESDFVV